LASDKSKGSKTNPTRERGDEVGGTRLTNTPCDHCGELIPFGQVVAVKRTSFSVGGGSRSRMFRFTKGHPTEARVA